MEITFEQLPTAVGQLLAKMEDIERLLQKTAGSQSEEADELLTVQDAAEFLKLTVPTIYGLISKGAIPVMKRSKRCYFSKQELLAYLRQGRKKTAIEAAEIANKYLQSKDR